MFNVTELDVCKSQNLVRMDQVWKQGMLLSTQEMHNIDDGSMLRRFGSPLLVSQFNHGNHVFDELFGFRCWSAASTQSSTLGAYTCSLIII